MDATRRRNLRELRAELIGAQGNRCGICGKLLFANWNGRGGGNRRRNMATLDHVWPLGVRVQWEGNLVGAHLRCNRRKANRLPTGCELIWLAAANAGLG